MDSFAHHGRDRLVHRTVEFGGCSKLVVTGEFAKSPSSADEDSRLERLRQAEKGEREDNASEPDQLEERPAPILELGREGRRDRTEDWATDGRDRCGILKRQPRSRQKVKGKGTLIRDGGRRT